MGLYKRARQGQLLDFTGIDSPPLQPELVLCTDQFTLNECVERILQRLEPNVVN